MATWNSTQPLRIPQTITGTDASGREEQRFSSFTEIHRGEPVPDEMMTASFIGGALNQMSNLTQADMIKLDDWKAKNPRIADKWDFLERTATFANVHTEGQKAGRRQRGQPTE